MTIETKPKSLVLIVGAGASYEVDLPLGSELKKQIAKALDIRFEHGARARSGDDTIYEVFNSLSRKQETNNINSYLHAAWHIRDAMPQAFSIDNFIDSHRSNNNIKVCGKLAITRCILNAEKNSKLWFNTSNSKNKINFEELESTWFHSFFNFLTQTRQENELAERFSKVAIICFNYDRCIEQYLYYSLINYYKMTSDQAADLVASIEIYHPYGTVGKLPWQLGKNESIEYGADPHFSELLSLSNELSTFTESVDESNSNILKIRSTLAHATKIACLGFAFHQQNIKLLFPDPVEKVQPRSSHIYATALGISVPTLSIIKSELSTRSGIDASCINLHLNDDCGKLLRNYDRTLSL